MPLETSPHAEVEEQGIETVEPQLLNPLEIEQQGQRTHEQILLELEQMQFLEHLRNETANTRLQIAQLELEKSRIDLETAKAHALTVGMTKTG